MLYALLHALLLIGAHDPLLPVSPDDTKETKELDDLAKRELDGAEGACPMAHRMDGSAPMVVPGAPPGVRPFAVPGMPAMPGIPGLRGPAQGVVAQQQLLQQLSQMTPAQMDALPEDVKAQVVQLLKG